MFTLSAFADEISPDPREQIAVLKSCRVRHIEFRSIHKTNVLALSDEQRREFKKMLKDEGFRLSAIGSPIGKIAIDAPFEPHLEKFKRAIELCGVFGTPNIRVFSYYPPGNDPNFDPKNWPAHRDEVIRRMRTKAEIAESNGIVLFHENEHRIYGDSPDRVADLLASVNSPTLRAAYDAANYVYGSFDPVEGWEKTKQYTAHFHIKDWKKGGQAAGHDFGVIAGSGDGQIEHSIRGAVAMGYRGFAVMEPHLRGGGPTGGITGADLFPYAVEAFRAILQKCGASEDLV
jgi:sugar phosphate isomerase/epimerase